MTIQLVMLEVMEVEVLQQMDTHKEQQEQQCTKNGGVRHLDTTIRMVLMVVQSRNPSYTAVNYSGTTTGSPTVTDVTVNSVAHKVLTYNSSGTYNFSARKNPRRHYAKVKNGIVTRVIVAESFLIPSLMTLQASGLKPHTI